MEKLIIVLKDWCVNSYEFSTDIEDESVQMVEDVLSDHLSKEDLEPISKKVAIFMENWIGNVNNQRLDIELMLISEQEEALDKLISSYI